MEIPSENNPVCIKCGLWKSCKTPFMESSGSDEPEVLVIGEAPGNDEDRKGIPFIGQSGQLLRNVLQEVGFDISNIRFTNVVRCRPPENKIKKRDINYCAQFALEDIKKYDPPLVFVLGNSPLEGILGQHGISQWNGVIIEKDDRIFLPLYHPAYILRNQNALDEWLEGMLKAVDGNEKRPKFIRTFPKTLKELDDMFGYLREFEYISFDTETSTLDPYSKKAKIISCSFAAGDHSYSFPLDHSESWWSSKDRENVIVYIETVLESHDGFVIAQNTKFDQMQVYKNLGIEFKAGGDSMLVSHLLDSRPGIHGLKRLAGIHLGMYEYEQELTDYIKAHKEANPAYGGSYENIPLKILLPYGAMDSEAALLVHDKLYPRLSEKQQILYDQLILPASDALCRMQCNGIAIDHYLAERYLRVYEIKQAEAYEKILQDKHVKKLIKDRQAISKKLFRFNPNSFVQLKDLYYKYYKMPVVGKQRSDGSISPTTSSSALKHLAPKYPVLNHVRYYKLLGSMISNYLRPIVSGNWLSDDGRARTTYNLHGAVTGRTSSSGGEGKKRVHLQNIPTPEKEPDTLLEILPIKNVFTHSYVRSPAECLISIGKNKFPLYNFKAMYGDGVVLSADYSGMELRTFFSLAKCKSALEILRSDKDFHSSVALRAITGKPIKSITLEEIAGLKKEIRYKYKWTNWTLIFGGSAETLHNLYNMPMDEAEQMFEDYFAVFPEAKEYQKECVEFAEEHGYIESPYGFREHLFYINDSDSKKRNADRRAAMNSPTQSSAGHTLLMALVIVDSKFSEYGFKSKLVNEVHDSIVADCPKEEVEDVAFVCKDVMENVKKYAKDYMPDIDMSWLLAPLKSDVDVGSHYGSLMSLEKWREYHGS